VGPAIELGALDAIGFAAAVNQSDQAIVITNRLGNILYAQSCF
jgi:hypothetical protein